MKAPERFRCVGPTSAARPTAPIGARRRRQGAFGSLLRICVGYLRRPLSCGWPCWAGCGAGVTRGGKLTQIQWVVESADSHSRCHLWQRQCLKQRARQETMQGLFPHRL